MYIGLHVKYPLFLSDLMKLVFSLQTSEKSSKYQTSRKSIQCEPSCSMHTDRRTDMTKLGVAFRNFVKTA